MKIYKDKLSDLEENKKQDKYVHTDVMMIKNIPEFECTHCTKKFQNISDLKIYKKEERRSKSKQLLKFRLKNQDLKLFSDKNSVQLGKL